MSTTSTREGQRARAGSARDGLAVEGSGLRRFLTWSRLRRFRQGVQILSFMLYIYLLFAALQRRAAFPLADLFFRLDPLAALTAMLAGREWIPRLALALVTLGLTLLFGRVWCGWLCPTGTLLEWLRFSSKRVSDRLPGRRPAALFRSKRVSDPLRTVKYWLLLLVLAAALFGNLTLLVFDPLTLFTRTMTTGVLPALNHAVTSVESGLYSVAFLRPAVDGLERLLRGPVLPVEQAVYALNALIAGLFLAIIALNALADRFWCRYLCPLGALLGLLAKVSLLRPIVGSACNRCGHCDGACRVDAIDTLKGYDIIPSECTVCLDCLEACPEATVFPSSPKDGLGFRWHWRPASRRAYDPNRRQALIALVGGAVGVAVLRTGIRAKQAHPLLVRPPGAQEEEAFLARCLRCSQCMKVCPTSGLQPALSEAGLEGLWTPVLVSRLGYCDYGCNACGQICPSSAIPQLALEEKRQQIIGIAVLDRDRCWPWAHGIPCIVCEEMCPTPEKAVRLEEVTVPDDRGEPVVVQQPYVLSDLCIGCGICEYQCPVEGEAAIRVYRE